MGYTHYWEVADISKHSKRPSAVISAMVKIAKNSPVPLAGGDGTGEPKASRKEIVFNGRSPDDYETFLFPGDAGHNFCKTGQRPYDIVVTACLAAAKDIYGSEIKVSSDGSPEEWEPGVALASRVLRRVIRNPIE
jgi:hypothetical protein